MKQSPIKRLLFICIVSGLIAGIITNILFWFVFPTAWFFFIIPAVMGWSIDRYGKIPHEHLQDEETFENLKKQTGLMCGAMSLIFVLLANIPLFIVMPLEYIVASFMFYIVCVISIVVGYNRGQQCIVDAYYDSNLAES